MGTQTIDNSLYTVSKRFLNSLYCAGYLHGHHETVEGGFIDVLEPDKDSFFDDEVENIFAEGV